MSRFNLQDLKTHITPIDPNIHLSKDQCSSTDDEKVSMSNIPYREAIRITYVGCSSHMTWYCLCSITIITISRKYSRDLLESSQESYKISGWDKELQANSQKKSWQPVRLCWCRLGIARSQALNISLYFPNWWRMHVLELSETKYSRTFINRSWVHCSNSCGERSTVVASFHYRSHTTI